MNIASIRVLNFEVPIHWETSQNDPRLKEYYGYYDMPTRKIVMDSHAPEEAQRETLLHEIIHVVFHACDIPEKKAKEEKVALLVSRSLRQVAKDNPAAWQWMGEDLAVATTTKPQQK